MATTESERACVLRRDRPKFSKMYPLWFYAPTALIYGVLFLVPTTAALYFSLTRWTLFESEFIGLENFYRFFQEPSLSSGLKNTIIYAFITSGSKVILGMCLALLLTSQVRMKPFLRATVFFPVLVSTIGVGLTFQVMMHPSKGTFNVILRQIGISGPGWLTDPRFALLSVAAVDVWKGVGLATVIFMAGLLAIPSEHYEAAAIDGASKWIQFKSIILPLSLPATSTVIILSLIGGLRTFDLIWAMTRGGPGFTSDVLASVIYKQYQAGFYGLSTAGNVVLFVLVAIIAVPLNWFLTKMETEL